MYCYVFYDDNTLGLLSLILCFSVISCLIPLTKLSMVCKAHWVSFFSLHHRSVWLCKSAVSLKNELRESQQDAYFMTYKKKQYHNHRCVSAVCFVTNGCETFSDGDTSSAQHSEHVKQYSVRNKYWKPKDGTRLFNQTHGWSVWANNKQSPVTTVFADWPEGWRGTPFHHIVCYRSEQNFSAHSSKLFKI